MTRRFRNLLLWSLLLGVSVLSAQPGEDERYALPRRTMPLEKILLKLSEAGAELSYRPDQIPKITRRSPGGKRPLAGWLEYFLDGTELTYESSGAGFLIFPDPDLPGRRFTIFGTVTDARSGERLIAAAIRDTAATGGTLTNEYGLYTLRTNGGRRRLLYSYVGYAPLTIETVLRGDTTLNVRLVPSSNLPEVIVTPTPDALDEAHLLETRSSVGRREARQLGGPGGVSDPFRVARLFAGVESGADGVGGIFVRGSEAGHNLVLLDGVPLYNLNHAAGLLSVFNNQAIRRMDLYKDGLPLRYGGRIGGVLDVHTRDGNYYDYATTLGADLLTLNLTAEGPINKGQSSFLIAGRNFWGRELLGRFSERAKNNLGRQGRMDYQVYDFNVKLNQRISQKGHLFLSLFNGRDHYQNDAFSSDQETVLTNGGGVFSYESSVWRAEAAEWGNTVGALRYNHVFNDHFFGNFRLSYSDLLVDAAFEKADSLQELNGMTLDNADVYSGRYGSAIRQLGAAFDGQVDVRNLGMVRFGGEVNLHRFLPQLVSGPQPLEEMPSLGSVEADGVIRPLQISLYGSYTGAWRGLRFRAGVRGQLWRSGRSFYDLSPRLLVAGKLGRKMTWRVTFDRAVQPIHLINSTNIGLPTDLWVPATEAFGPSTSNQLAGQLTRALSPSWNLVLGAYQRNIRNLVEFTESGLAWQENLSAGRGSAQGLELTLNRTRGVVSGWINYTLANSRRDFDEGINLGRPFNFRYGRRHSVKMLLRYQPTGRFSLTAGFRYGTGAFFSLSRETLRLVDPAQAVNPEEFTIDLITEKNGVRLPANHRLDLNANFELPSRTNALLGHQFSLGIYNVYDRHNPIYYDVESDYQSVGENLINNRRFKQVFIPGLLPSISYQLHIRSRPRQ